MNNGKEIKLTNISGDYARIFQGMLLLFIIPFCFLYLFITLNNNLNIKELLYGLLIVIISGAIIRYGFLYSDIFLFDDKLIVKKIFSTKKVELDRIEIVEKTILPLTYRICFSNNFKVYFFLKSADIFKSIFNMDSNRVIDEIKVLLKLGDPTDESNS